ncbi:hypothetical protein A0J61_09899 [Choanephora cucurbitarum]|uniref:Uncharacterized protein n=1 Tax=Choanephora cucurbitarum TaxID=101091 RepID=A0A1C7MZ47_9FUNG|nr:hypothetical protein A0J61_09899 [Choanephora cucurbitarum]
MMWIENNTFTESHLGYKEQLNLAPPLDRFSDDDMTETDTDRTLSSITDLCLSQFDSCLHLNDVEEDTLQFEQSMQNSKVSHCQNTYFMDGGNRFISLPMLGNACTKAASHISRVFEEWLQNKLYHQNAMDDLFERLPILEDSVELLAEDVINRLKSRNSVRGLIGLSRILIKIRTGHVYTYHPLENGQPLITADMEDFFQQFPLFVETTIYTMPRESNQSADDVQVLLTVENITINPANPYHIKQAISLIA